jgi:hypothetical protein
MKESKALKSVSEQQVRKRLKGKMTPAEISEALEAYRSASESQLPDMGVISQLAEKKKVTNTLKVNFTLSEDEYDLLSEYFEVEGKSGTQVVKTAISEWIASIAE